MNVPAKEDMINLADNGMKPELPVPVFASDDEPAVPPSETLLLLRADIISYGLGTINASFITEK